MDGTILPFDARERRSPAATAAPSGLPIFATEPLTADEHEVLRRAARILRVIADNLDDARYADRVTYALQAVDRGTEAGRLLIEIATRLGSGR